MGVLFLLCSLVPPPDFPLTPPPLLSAKGVRRVARLAEGCVLVRRVRTGMREEQVRRILGDHQMYASGGARFGAWVGIYTDLGVQVFWSSSFEERVRGEPPVVWEVRYVWECWTEWGGEK